MEWTSSTVKTWGPISAVAAGAAGAAATFVADESCCGLAKPNINAQPRVPIVAAETSWP